MIFNYDTGTDHIERLHSENKINLNQPPHFYITDEIILSEKYKKVYNKIIDEINNPKSQFYSQTLQTLNTLKGCNIIDKSAFHTCS